MTPKHKTEGIIYHISDVQITHLHTATLAMQEAQKQDAESGSDGDTAYARAEQRFNDDLVMLQRLLADWQSVLGTNDVRIGLIGMVNTRRGGNSGRPGVRELQLQSALLKIEIIPDVTRPAATSYQTYFRATGWYAGLGGICQRYRNSSVFERPPRSERCPLRVSYPCPQCQWLQ